MILIGLTGGIGSGKSTVARLLGEMGAEIIDADLLGHEGQVPGGPAYEPIVRRFGPKILKPDGTIDRARLAEIVFSDPQALKDLNAITHPAIYRTILSRLEELRSTHRLVVLDAPLLVETLQDRGRSLGMDALVVVAAGIEDQIERVARDRGMTAEDARARIKSQAPQSVKLAAADYIVDNRGTVEDLQKSVDVLFDDLTARFGARGAR